ncbi:hypothetical protein DFH07DRAFT_768464 [Mycena maculata]|uniref:Uncharacterized protein n=1 Tax=Mycena maculata TaxID=230809 RepID=A0AAD7NQQ7_9AGAR|nr:hypothetical protein DFH07DRAFT_768464 [Mycena maculata]
MASSPSPTLSRLQSLSFVKALDYKAVADFLHRRTTTPGSTKFRSFCLVCSSGSFLRDNLLVDFVGNGGRQFGQTLGPLATLARQGLDIRIGTTEETYIEHIHQRRATRTTHA